MNSDQIEQLTNLRESVRKRPGMYFGFPGARGLAQWVAYLVDGCLDLQSAPETAAQILRLTLRADRCLTVEGTTHRTAAEWSRKVLTVHGRDFDIALPVCAAAAKLARVTLWEDPVTVIQFYPQAGEPIQEIPAASPPPPPWRYELAFQLDDDFFLNLDWDYGDAATLLHQLALLNPGLKLILRDERHRHPVDDSPREEIFYFPGGFVEMLRRERGFPGPTFDAPVPIPLNYELDEDRLGGAIQLEPSGHSRFTAYVNGSPVPMGVPRGALQGALARVMNQLRRQHGHSVQMGDCATPAIGYTCVLDLRIRNPQFGSPTRDKLVNPSARRLIGSGVYRNVRDFLAAHPDIAARLVRGCR